MLATSNDLLSVGTFEEEEYHQDHYIRIVELEIVIRECLRCDRKFRALGRFTRVCRDCHCTPSYCGASQILDFCS